MSKILFNKKNFLKITTTNFIIVLLLTLLSGNIGDLPLHEAFLMVRENYVVLGGNEFHTSFFLAVIIFLFIVPQILQMVLDDYEIAKAYIFVRLKNIKKWYFLKLLQVTGYSLFFAFVYNTFVLLVAICWGAKLTNAFLLFNYFTAGIITSFFICFFFVIIGFTLSFRLKAHYVGTVIVSVLTIIITLTNFANHPILQFKLFAIYIVSFHIVNNPQKDIYFFDTWVYFVIWGVIASLITFAGYRLLKKTDSI